METSSLWHFNFFCWGLVWDSIEVNKGVEDNIEMLDDIWEQDPICTTCPL
jgi:hypothetical protein